MPSKPSSASSQRQTTATKSRSGTATTSGSGKDAELQKRQGDNLSRPNTNKSNNNSNEGEEPLIIVTDLPREWEDLRLKVMGWEIAYLLDAETEIFDDDDIPDQIVQKWEWVSRLVISNQAQLTAKHPEQNMMSSFAKVLNTGMGAEGSQAKAESHYKRGKQLYDMGEFDDAVKEYKEASNWYFKGGERRLRCMPLLHT
jgi:hypothetical protein